MSGFKLNGKFTWCDSDKNAYIEALRALKLRHPRLYSELAYSLNTPKRRYFSNSRLSLFPQSAHLADKEANAALLESGWYTNTNISNKQKEEIISKACAITGILYIFDLELKFENGSYCPMTKEQAVDDLERMFGNSLVQVRKE